MSVNAGAYVEATALAYRNAKEHGHCVTERAPCKSGQTLQMAISLAYGDVGGRDRRHERSSSGARRSPSGSGVRCVRLSVGYHG